MTLFKLRFNIMSFLHIVINSGRVYGIKQIKVSTEVERAYIKLSLVTYLHSSNINEIKR